MPSQLRLFVASPSDLAAEREVVARVAERLNQSLAERLDVAITVLRWENVPPRAGRPQDTINSNLLERADVVVAILHRRLGSPSGNGDLTGFVEEFEVATRLRKTANRPEVALFFKEIDPELLADPGPRLSEVLAFRNRVESEHLALFSTFTSTGEFEAQVTYLLVDQLHRVGRLGDSGQGYDAARGPARVPELGARSGVLDSTLSGLASLVRREDCESPIDVDRLRLFAIALSDDEDFLSAHLANRLFNARPIDDLELVEQDCWIRAHLADCGGAPELSERVIPVFGIVGGESGFAERLESRAHVLAADSDSTVVRGLLEALRARLIRPTTLWSLDEPDRAREWWENFARKARDSVLRYWAIVATQADAGLAELLLQSDSLEVARVGEAMIGLIQVPADLAPLATLDPNLILTALPIGAAMREGALQGISRDVLEQIAGKTWHSASLRTLAAEELLRRGQFGEELVGALFDEAARTSVLTESDSDWMVAVVGSEAGVLAAAPVLAKRARDANSRDEALAIVRRLKQFRTPLGELLGGVSVPTTVLPRLLSESFAAATGTDALVDEARALARGTHATFNEYIKSLSVDEAELAKLTEFLVDQAAFESLRYLAWAPSVGFSPFVRAGLRRLGTRSRLFKLAALDLLARNPAPSDVELILAGSAEVRLDQNRTGKLLEHASLKLLRELALRDDGEFAHLALHEMRRRGRSLPNAQLESLLYSPSSKARMEALGLLASKLESAALGNLSRRYAQSRAQYYYNVVCELDRLVASAPVTSASSMSVPSQFEPKE